MFNTSIVGILNVTPDSFSDGGENFTPEEALVRVKSLIEEGADIIDIGAESTRPGAIALSAEEEWARLEPVITRLSQFPDTEFSLDTRHPETVRRVIPLGGIAWINDVSGFSNAEMVAVVREADFKLVLMHSLTVPADKAVVMPEGDDVMESLIAFADKRISELEKAGIDRSRIIFDPGIGFGKTTGQSLQIVKEIRRFISLDVPLYLGHSRKSFLSDYDRDAATLAISQFLISRGVDYIRVHDVASHKKLLTLMNALYHE